MGHDNVTFEGGLVDFVCQVPWTPGKVPSTPAVLRCPSARWIAPFSAGVAPFFPKSYAHLRMVTPISGGCAHWALPRRGAVLLVEDASMACVPQPRTGDPTSVSALSWSVAFGRKPLVRSLRNGAADAES